MYPLVAGFWMALGITLFRFSGDPYMRYQRQVKDHRLLTRLAIAMMAALVYPIIFLLKICSRDQ